MRKLMVLPLAGLLALGVAGPVAAGANVANTSGSGETIYGEWSSGNTYGSVYVGKDSAYGTYAEIYQESGEWVPCDVPTPDKGASTVYDTTGGDGDSGFVGIRTWGSAEGLTVEVSRRLDTGRATGSVELYTSTVDECNGVYGDAVESAGTLDVSVVGTGPIASYRGTSHYQVPSQFSGHDNYRAKERAATGSIVAGDKIDATFAGAMSLLTWSAHAKE